MKLLSKVRTTLATLILASSLPALAENAQYRIDEDHFSIGFLVEHIGYADTLGQFLEAEGSFVYDEAANELREGEVLVQADSVFTNHDRRDEHLRNDDFLDADEHATIRFEATDWQPEDDDPRRGTLEGKLTLLGETRPVSLDVTLNKAAEYPFGHGEYTLGVSARTTIRRSEWGMTYGVERNLVGDEVDLIFEFEAIRE
ncbi:YceI family protein [Wenzhouxiangella sediminis]|uniref:Polyisoprenoid-binding protein n=1 Tax=Wenzhouxiangella sediminis TaxID=1792836 RepID=A0A3E1K693_9GAMM|nr:polyisoprenoid-binding protein [Wenzhouxiangella sediminis]